MHALTKSHCKSGPPLTGSNVSSKQLTGSWIWQIQSAAHRTNPGLSPTRKKSDQTMQCAREKDYIRGTLPDARVGTIQG